jgi:hypothetical protein
MGSHLQTTARSITPPRGTGSWRSLRSRARAAKHHNRIIQRLIVPGCGQNSRQSAAHEARSFKDLTAAIGAFIDACNERCQPFTWTKNAGELLAKIRPPKR